VLGGLDSPIGAVVGGLTFGVLLNLVSTYWDFIGGALKLPVGLAVILLVLLVRPSGLFGRRSVRKV
jgi:branched-chain amino acid transport system permease protein